MSANVNRALFEYGSQRANPTYNLMNPIDIPYGAEPAEVSRKIRGATDTIRVEGRAGRNAYAVNPQFNPNRVPDNATSRLRESINICEAVKTPDCNAFKNPKFAATCMISHDVGRNSKGEAHTGGLVLFSEDREDQYQANRRKGRYATYNPTVGESAQGRTSTDYNSCVAMDEKIRCEKQGNFDIPNCAMCMNGQGRFARVDPEAAFAVPKLVVVGRGNISVYQNGNSDQSELAKDVEMNETTPVTIDLRPDSEGKSHTIEVNNPNGKPTLAGYLEGPNSSGTTRIDLSFLCDYEYVFGTKPLIIGSSTINDETVSLMTTASGRRVNMGQREQAILAERNQGSINNIMNLGLRIPYTFLDSSEEASAECPGGPFSKKEASVKLLSADPCFNPNRPGQHKLECLQNKFLQAGCTVMGEGYPQNEDSANLLRMVNGVPQAIGAVSKRIYDTSLEAATGIGANGQKLTMEQWDQKSRWCTGKAITTPCAGYDPINGPLGDECIQYLFENGGSMKTEGRTYTLGQNYESLNTAGRQCTRNGAAAPFNPDNLQKARAKGGVNEVKKYFNEMQLKAQNNSLSDTERQQAIKDCYGINLAASAAANNAAFNSVEPRNDGTNTLAFQIPNTDRFIRHAGFDTWHHENDGSDIFREDSSWKVVPPLCGKPGYLSFESKNFPEHYLINNNGRGRIVPQEQTPEYNQRACWRPIISGNGGYNINPMDPTEKVQSGIGCGLPGFGSLENAFTPGAFLRAGPAEAADLYIPKTEADRKATCLQFRAALGPNDTPKVTFYQHPGYQGREVSLGIGNYNMNEMQIGNDVISSLKVPRGLKVILYQHHNFTGRTLTVTEDDPNLGNDGFHDETSSLKIMRA